MEMKNIQTEPLYIRVILITFSLIFLLLFLILPIFTIFYEGLREGMQQYFINIKDPYTISSLKLTAIVTFFSVLFNTIFGFAAAWSISKFEFKGKNILTTLIDLPFSISPIIAGLIYVIFLGSNSMVGGWFAKHNFYIIFALPGIIITTIFITLPFIAKELIPLMEQQGIEEEEAAMLLGAKGWQILYYITLPKIRWGLIYGILLCSARSMGEFGAVSIVSGHISGLTNTAPLHIENLYNEYNFVGAFAVASLLTIGAIITLIIKNIVKKNNE